MSIKTSGLHHVTAIGGDPQRNADFYHRTLGLRLVKTTVNFDDPGTYHLYYGDRAGNPGTIMTFFPWPGAPKGRIGAGQATTTTFSVPEGSLGWWDEHLRSLGVRATRPGERGEEDVLSLRDPDGLVIELAASADHHDTEPWDQAGVPAEQSRLVGDQTLDGVFVGRHQGQNRPAGPLSLRRPQCPPDYDLFRQRRRR